MVSQPEDDADEYLRDSTSINILDVNGEYVRLSSDLSYWNERYADCVRSYLDAKTERERVLAAFSTDRPSIAALETQLDKRPTVDQIKAAALCSADYLGAKGLESYYDSERLRLRGRVEAISAKRDMLISLGATLRLELLRDPVIRRNLASLRTVDADEPGDSDGEVPL